MTESNGYFGNTYCCPACGTSFSLILREITGTGTLDADAPVLRCPSCRADTAIRVSQAEMRTITTYVLSRAEAKQLIRLRMQEKRKSAEGCI
ncbi:hypothetical protein [Methanorbis rubei]|uniref:Uncharacterized protein n=1 Tax=Methanorbis rubei TaxID=3028300 RepID=A0AAE4MHQ6_9EURY|nr:hypothetical protein [Methanocorpusculaceae archaeon Cs1]